MQFQCTKCQGIIDIEEEYLGQAIACGHCNSIIMVPSSPVGVGAVIGGDFVIQGEIASGGMGMVYLAYQISLDRKVALKIMHDEYAQDPTFVDNFLREARAAACLNHPNIVQAYAVGESDGRFYFAMEYLEGENLKEILDREGKLSQARVLAIVQDVARALNFAWKNQRLVHRDIKPENIIITKDQVVKLSDLGLARYGVESGVRERGETVYGTPQYISPEQYLNLTVDVRSDLYSLGATAWHLLTGHPPFEANTPAEIATMHLNSRLPRLYQVEESVNRQTSTLISIMMSKRPSLRHADATEFLKDVARVIVGDMPATPLSRLAQVPIFLDGSDPLDVSNIPQDVVALRTPIELTKKDLVKTAEEAGEQVNKPVYQRPVEKRFNPIPWLVSGLVVLMIGGAATYFWLDSTKEIRDLKTKNPTYPEESHQAYLDVKQSVLREDPKQVKVVGDFIRKYSKCSKYCNELKKMIEPVLLRDIAGRRKQPFQEEKQKLRVQWEAHVSAAHANISTQIVDTGNKAQEAAVKAVAPDNKKDIERSKKNEVERLMMDARSRVTALCRSDRYNEATQEQVVLTLAGRDTYGSEEWANSYLNIVNRAKQLSEMLKGGRRGDYEKDSGLEMTDAKVGRNYYGRYIREKVPAYAYPRNYDATNQYYLYIDNYSATTVTLGYYELKVRDGRNAWRCSGNKTIEYRLLPLDLERAVYDVILANLNRGLNPDQMMVVRNAYLFIRGEDLAKVREDLDTLKRSGRLSGEWERDVDFILAELNKGDIAEQLNDAAWCADMMILEGVVARNNKDEIDLYEKAMNRRYADRLNSSDESRSDLQDVLKKQGFNYEKYRNKWNEKREALISAE